MDRFTKSYLETILWAELDPDTGEVFDEKFGFSDFSADAVEIAIKDCTNFQLQNADDLIDIDDAEAGHNFWLTRRGHGAGFWDMNLGRVGERLTAAAHSYRDCYVYVGYDGKVYIA